MGDSSSNSQNTTQNTNSWLGTGISVFGGMMSSINNFAISQIKNAPVPSYVRSCPPSWCSSTLAEPTVRALLIAL